MKKVTLLGAGLVGKTMALDLASEQGVQVRVADRDCQALARLAELNESIQTQELDARQKQNLKAAVEDADIVINAVPGNIGFAVLCDLVSLSKNVVDIAFFSEDTRHLDAECKSKGCFAVYDCGVSPGISNYWIGKSAQSFDRVDSLRIVVGGLPVVRRYPFEYAAVFSPSDVIEEYVRPARTRFAGRIVMKEALSEPELFHFDQIGTLEGFQTDGLRSLLQTMDIPDMEEKTLRYPGHCDRMHFLREAGFFSEDELDVAGAKVRPVDLTDRLFREAWKLKPGDTEFTVLRVELKGERKGKEQTDQLFLLDYTDQESGFSSMARSTGFTATSTVLDFLAGNAPQPGFYAPEQLPQNCDAVLSRLRSKGLKIEESSS